VTFKSRVFFVVAVFLLPNRVAIGIHMHQDAKRPPPPTNTWPHGGGVDVNFFFPVIFYKKVSYYFSTLLYSDKKKCNAKIGLNWHVAILKYSLHFK
jgi:hypothetical protein